MFIINFIPIFSSSCESQWHRENILNITYNKTFIINNTIITNNKQLYIHETGNAISSLIYVVFGIYGLIPNNQSTLNYLIMDFFIATGIGSFLHHYYYYVEWAWAADIIPMKLLPGISLFYIICDTNLSYYGNKLLGLLIVLLSLTTLVFFKINYGPRIEIFKGLIFSIIATQFYICFYFFYIKSYLKWKVCCSLVWSSILFSTGSSLWYFDKECPLWSWYTFNGHVFWHIFIAWALFIVINITNLYHATIKNLSYLWIPLIKKYDWFIFLIVLKPNYSDNKKNITRTKLSYIKYSTNCSNTNSSNTNSLDTNSSNTNSLDTNSSNTNNLDTNSSNTISSNTNKYIDLEMNSILIDKNIKCHRRSSTFG